ncbi:polysaccharide deacetylase family protein [Metabacillus litoralis]|jgi:peptidoglycan-N-acetylglucosamine deacetylase|uniref:polysaccharide deacetylase family protein n=1 Tax=Metabacillus litoralis TaxID=152268 RepID=UPI00204099AF|nr:polysaccharide deacetylase [Metabacillus litoralis]MCM3653821.1 polysaccharide deacetylase [Metabacillus litoralis]
MVHSIKWPNEKKMAVLLTFDVDAETAHVADPHNINRPSVLSMGTYGRRVGLNRILEVLRKYDIKSTFFVPGATAELDPTVLERIMKHDHAIGHHGYLHKRSDILTVEEEEAELVKGIDVLKKYTGKSPIGYRAPLWEMHARTPALLKKYGFVYDSSLQADDIPYVIEGGDGTLLEIPGTWLLDDWEQFAFSGDWSMPFQIEEPDKVFRLWKAEFDALYEEGRCFNLTMHPQLIGRASRIALLDKLIAYMKTKQGVWFTTGDELARHWQKNELEFDYIPNPDPTILFPNVNDMNLVKN